MYAFVQFMSSDTVSWQCINLYTHLQTVHFKLLMCSNTFCLCIKFNWQPSWDNCFVSGYALTFIIWIMPLHINFQLCAFNTFFSFSYPCFRILSIFIKFDIAPSVPGWLDEIYLIALVQCSLSTYPRQCIAIHYDW